MFFDRAQQTECPRMSCQEEVKVPVLGGAGDRPRESSDCTEERIGEGRGVFFLFLLQFE